MRITNEDQYNRALARIERLLELRHSGRESHELQMLMEAVDDYEQETLDAENDFWHQSNPYPSDNLEDDCESIGCDSWLSQDIIDKINQGLKEAKEGKVRPFKFNLDDEEWLNDYQEAMKDFRDEYDEIGDK